MKQLKNVKTLSTVAMLIAIGILLGFFKIPITEVLEIRFGSIPIAIAGSFFGPGISALVGALTDIGGFIVKPTGPYFPGFTISSIVTGIIFGFMFHKKEMTISRIVLAQIINTVLVGIVLNSIWLSMLYGNAFIVVVSTRVIKELLMIPINVLILTAVLKPISQLRIQHSLAK